MNKKSPGSAILLVLGVASTVVILSLVVWHKMSLMIDLVAERERFYKNFYRTETILQVGLTTVRENFDTLMQDTSKQKMPITLTITTPPGFFEPGIIARCVVDWHEQLKNDTLLVRALVYDHQCVISALSCVCTKKQTKQTIHSQPMSIEGGSNAQQPYYFVVRNFTIGTVV